MGPRGTPRPTGLGVQKLGSPGLVAKRMSALDRKVAIRNGHLRTLGAPRALRVNQHRSPEPRRYPHQPPDQRRGQEGPHKSAGLEIVYPAYDGKLYAYAADGSTLWTYVFGTGSAPYTGASEALIADLSGDGVPEVLFTTFTSGAPREPEVPAHLIILNNNGAELQKVELFGRGSMAAPTLADLDADGDLELIISLKDTLGGADGGVQIWDLPGASDNCLQWKTGRGGWLRQGRAQ